VKDLVDSNFKPLGFYSIDTKPLWAMPMPGEEKELKVLKHRSHGSAGGLMKNILGLAFKKADPKVDSKTAELVAEAKKHAASIVKELYG
jgi:hypothetical protein